MVTSSHCQEYQLRNIIPEFCRDYDGARGEIQLEGFIVSRGFSVTQKVLRNTIKSLPMYDDARKQRKYRNKVPRQHYYAPGIGWLWHIDTHFKLARWGFIFVGVIDGGSRELICVDIELDKTSHSILKSVLASDGFKKYGVPKTLSMDRGTENIAIARFLHHFGCDINAVYSPHNIKIEAWWRHFRQNVASFYEEFFKHLEQHVGLNVKNPSHIWLMQYLFYDRVKKR
jgi:hypothetical protein